MGLLLVTRTCCSSPGENSFAGRLSSWKDLSSNFAPLQAESSLCACPLDLLASSRVRNVVARCPWTTTAGWPSGAEDTQTEGALPSMQIDLVCSGTDGLPEAASKTWSK